MPIPIIGAVDAFLGGAGGGLVGRLIDFVDPAKKREAEQEARNVLIEFASEMDKSQNEINKEQAKHDSLFVAGARPFAMWGAAICFFYTVGGVPFLQNMMEIFMPVVDSVTGRPEPTPIPKLSRLDTEEVRPLLYGLLGLGGFRMGEKMMGVSRESMNLKPGGIRERVRSFAPGKGRKRQGK